MQVLAQLVDMLKLLAGAKPPALTPGLTLLLTMSVNDAADAPSVGTTQVCRCCLCLQCFACCADMAGTAAAAARAYLSWQRVSQRGRMAAPASA